MPMMRPFLSVALLLTLGLSAGWAQKESTAQPPAEERGTYLGVLFAPVPDIVYDQLPQLPRDRGVVISHVLPDSPATKAGRILRVPCTGTPKEIDDQVTKLPEGVQKLVRVALRRLREPEAQTPPRPAR